MLCGSCSTESEQRLERHSNTEATPKKITIAVDGSHKVENNAEPVLDLHWRHRVVLVLMGNTILYLTGATPRETKEQAAQQQSSGASCVAGNGGAVHITVHTLWDKLCRRK
jgi:hypothetical protein